MSAVTTNSFRPAGYSVLRRPALPLLLLGVLVALPVILPTRAIGIAIQILVAALFALAFNILWRQTRLLSFGHAAFFGAGMFATVHLMRVAEGGAFAIPLPLMPIAGLVAGALLGSAVGYFATARTGTYFAMITLAFGEVIHQIAPQWEAVFGGEAGLSTMRTPWAGLTFGSSTQVYYLVLFWVVLAIGAIYAFITTPLGRLSFALGDNEERARFLGYKTRIIKTVIFAISAMFAGLAGGLLAVANENVDYSIFAAGASGVVVLHTFIGGAEFFWGPILGAALLTGLGSVISDATRQWALYQGLLFIVIVMFLPQGIVGFISAVAALARRNMLRPLIAPALLGLVGLVLVACGAVIFAELIYAFSSNPMVLSSGTGSVRLWSLSWSAKSWTTWVTPAASIIIGSGLFYAATRLVAMTAEGDHPEGI